MRITAVIALFADLGEAELTTWVARGWVRPDQPDPTDHPGAQPADQTDRPGARPADQEPDQHPTSAANWNFLEIDVARVRLIHDLRRSMDIAEETMPVVLSLLDQVYALRGTLRDLLHALESQPEPVRTSILATLRRD